MKTLIVLRLSKPPWAQGTASYFNKHYCLPYTLPGGGVLFLFRSHTVSALIGAHNVATVSGSNGYESCKHRTLSQPTMLEGYHINC